MLDLLGIIGRAAQAVGDERRVLAAPFHLADRLCSELVERGIISGYIRSCRPQNIAHAPGLAGWWVDGASSEWFIRPAQPTTILLLGGLAEQVIGGTMLLEARLKGVTRICLIDASGTIIKDVNVGAELLRRLGNVRTVWNDKGRFSFEAAYEEFLRLAGEMFRLPTDCFIPNRVLHIVGSLGPGGAERQLCYTAAGLAQSGDWDVYVACHGLSPPGDLFKPYVEASGARVVLIPVESPDFDSPEMLALRNGLAHFEALGFGGIIYHVFHYCLLMRSLRPAIIHTWMDYCNVIGGIASELVGVPITVLSGRSVAPDNFPNLFQPYMHAGYKQIMRRRQALLLNNSAAGAEDYTRWLSLQHGSIRIIRNGFVFPPQKDRETRESLRKDYGLPKDAPVVGTIIRFSEEKRPALFVDAAALVHERHPDVKFLACGTGDLHEQTRLQVQRLGLSEVILLPGIAEDAWSALAVMDVFVLCSRMEGLPNVLVEAQAAGVPVVCTAVGGMVETYLEGETGFGVPEATAGAIAEKICELINDTELRSRASRRATEHARSDFGLDRMIRETNAAYRDAQASLDLFPMLEMVEYA